jgi:hypothetical protein
LNFFVSNDPRLHTLLHLGGQRLLPVTYVPTAIHKSFAMDMKPAPTSAGLETCSPS